MPAERFRFEEYELDPKACELRLRHKSVHLERIPFELLSLLVERSGQLVTREEMIERAWGKGVFHDTEHGINTAVRKIRLALQDDVDSPRFVLTVPARGYRFVAPVETVGPSVEPAAAPQTPPEESSHEERAKPDRRKRILIPGAVFLACLGLAAFFYFHRARPLTGKDTIVLADFANHTGDPVFDDTLKQALAVELGQSPFLNILSEEKIAETMQMMGRAPDERVDKKTAMEICQRRQSTAVLAGSITTLGDQYVIGLNLVTCRTGELFAQAQLQAESKAEVLKVVDRAATKLRDRLGESRGMIQRFDIPVEQATTASLPALQAYSLGRKNVMAGNFAAAVPAFQEAVKLDPKFAMAYAMLASSYSNVGELDLAAKYANDAYELRERVSEKERFYIESHYQMFVTGNMEKGMAVFELWSQVYPRDDVPVSNLGATYGNIGQFDKALEKFQESLRLDPDSPLAYATVGYAYRALNRFDDARSIIAEARARNRDSAVLHIDSYVLASARNDPAAMQRELSWAAGKRGIENTLLACNADAVAYSGKLQAAREISRRAITSAQLEGETEEAANYQASSAVREALYGNFAEGRRRARTTPPNLRNENVLFLNSLALALAEDNEGAEKVAHELSASHPEDTIVQFLYLPPIRAQLALNRRNFKSAIEFLETAAPYELGDEGGCGVPIALYPIYVRGKVYLAEKHGAAAATEFQKILDHHGEVQMGPIGALAHLEIGRAYALEGEKDKAHEAYRDFFALWKDADANIPILKAAKAEFNLQNKHSEKGGSHAQVTAAHS